MIDWNGNGKIDPIDIGITAGMINSEDDFETEFAEEIDSSAASSKKKSDAVGFLGKWIRRFR